ncbi:hypothetical membrane associated protein [Streptococcus pyogenes]|uniref:hypothetical protein n=1 Tax=Streptococcus pyogenes TaxID=1314 RepID=UPI0010A0D9DB|nr:hypothetical protein [Streptococcus pyogenes]VHK43815.1 hypothetical membrane associated protein [Streptococcus pyogenes]HEP2035842.1 hypothetical protein [Streptococcus pyogenes]HEP2260692.1 hypothetical protein [Streptococcus pyogenes]HES8116201.1 hypothetical protein [Streptococcus pyogenes]
MKTRSKRFLNLATLCLALLGTTLLTTQPVKAAEISGSRSGEQVTNRRQFGGYQEAYDQGLKEGYEEGRKEGAPEDPENNDNVRKNADYKPSNVGDPNVGYPYDGYRDGFDSGYAKGWHETNDGGSLHHQESQDRKKAQDKVGESTGDSHHPESQGSEKTQDVEESTGDSHHPESQGSEKTQDVEESTDDLVSSLLSEIVETVGTFVAFLWTLFGQK